jgi:sugar/nucleoside kinase (ribokinase family)
MLDEAVFQGRRLCIVGNICRDVKTAPLPPEEGLFRDGETPTEFIIDTLGGGGANSALSAAGLGALVRFAGKVGDDALGAKLEAVLLARGVKTFLRRDPQTPTGSSIALSFTNGCRHFISSQPNNDTLSFDDIDLELLAEGGHLLRADVWFSAPMLAGGNGRLLEAARGHGLSTSLDLNWDPRWGFASENAIQERKQAVRQVLPVVDVVHGNIRELGIFADSRDLADTLKCLTDWGAGAVVVHMGAKGAGYYCQGQFTVEPCAPVRRHVNATGTGDLLSVCMMLLHDRKDVPIPEKLRLANRIVAEFIEGKRDLLPRLSPLPLGKG